VLTQSLNRSIRLLPPGLVGGLGGGLGALPLLPIVASLARRYSPAPDLPGVELLLDDRKPVTYAEMGVIVLVLPMAAVLFGGFLPRWFERWEGPVLAIEWAGLAFALSFPLALAGIAPADALAAGLGAAIAVVVVLAAMRSRA
jgi:hypothetical protein